MCPFWIRWYHQRKRDNDRVRIFLGIHAILGLQAIRSGESNRRIEGIKISRSHWNCPCGKEDKE